MATTDEQNRQREGSGTTGCSAALRKGKTHDFAYWMSNALRWERYDVAAAIRDEVERRRAKGTLNENVVERILREGVPGHPKEYTRLAFESAA